jgi:eukaryotic-like serine/threonine-protein kinase
VLHRDVKSPNFFLTSDASRLKVGDLGLAGRMDTFGTTPGVNAPQLYSPPELLTPGRLTRASDLYSMGLVLHELVCGPFPYAEYKTADVVSRLTLGRSPIRKRDLAIPVWVPSALRRVMKKSTAPRPGDRFQTARQMSDALARLRVVDWVQVAEFRWEAPFVHHPSRRVSVVGRRRPRLGTYGMTISTYQSAWRARGPERAVPSLDSAEAVRVFDQATNIAAAS